MEKFIQESESIWLPNWNFTSEKYIWNKEFIGLTKEKINYTESGSLEYIQTDVQRKKNGKYGNTFSQI